MKTRLVIFISMVIVSVAAFAQRPTLELTFTAEINGTHVQLDSIKIMNRTQLSETMIYWPDTTLSLEISPGDLLLYIGYATGYLGMEEIDPKMNAFQLFQNYPNPLNDQSIISMFTPGKGTVNVTVTDLQGRVMINSDWQLEKGNHSFRFIPGNGSLYVLTARWNGISRSIKIITTGSYSRTGYLLDYAGGNSIEIPLKSSPLLEGSVLESGILDSPVTNETYTFQFATNIPCPGTPTVEYEGQTYNTIQIFSQCWLKENLNAGTMIQGNEEMTDNGILEKYCHNNNPDSCTKYGGLYQWDEIIKYATQQGVQGICPTNWHLPTDEEWKVLEGAVDGLYGMGDDTWDYGGYRGYHAGQNLKTTSGWNENSNGTDLFGFSGLPGGYRYTDGGFYDVGLGGNWWTSTEYDYDFAWSHNLSYGTPQVGRSHYSYKDYGFSVRCLRDN